MGNIEINLAWVGSTLQVQLDEVWGIMFESKHEVLIDGVGVAHDLSEYSVRDHVWRQESRNSVYSKVHFISLGFK